MSYHAHTWKSFALTHTIPHDHVRACTCTCACHYAHPCAYSCACSWACRFDKAGAAPWMPIIRESLGDDCVCIACGCMLSFPQSDPQPLHQDGPHLSNNGKPLDRGSGEVGDLDAIPKSAKHLQAHAINIFIPLVDLNQGTSRPCHAYQPC